jgi:NADP-dependent 3-hydroxy acid dehydrogenase YdfG
LEHQVVLVTGANNGIEPGLVRSLLPRGWRVAALDLSGENLVGLGTPATLRFLACDVTDPAAVERAVAAVIAGWDKVDVLVNNACLAVFAPFEAKSMVDTRREFEVNYFGFLNMIGAVLPSMKERRRGVIHNVSSTVGRKLAGKIGSTKPVLTADVVSAAGVFMIQHFPRAMGRFLGARAQTARDAVSHPAAPAHWGNQAG